MNHIVMDEGVLSCIRKTKEQDKMDEKKYQRLFKAEVGISHISLLGSSPDYSSISHSRFELVHLQAQNTFFHYIQCSI